MRHSRAAGLAAAAAEWAGGGLTHPRLQPGGSRRTAALSPGESLELVMRHSRVARLAAAAAAEWAGGGLTHPRLQPQCH